MEFTPKCEAQVKFKVTRPEEKPDGAFVTGSVRTEINCARCPMRSSATVDPINNDVDLQLEMGYMQSDAKIMLKKGCRKWKEQLNSRGDMPDEWLPPLS